MSLAIATSASSPSSSAASASPVPPPTPLTPVSASNGAYTLPNNSNDQFSPFDGLEHSAQPAAAQGQVGPARRKPSRRANTAERRATHNAVERQRRETLNSRFLDLAALLPNLTSVRRPSKSAIVNSSIALIHSQRRARSSAARELRLLKLEADQFRAELNEWRERAGVARHEEPVRTREFEEMLTLEESDEDLEQAERRAMDMARESLRMDGVGPEVMNGNPFAFNGMGLYGGLDEDDEDCSSDGQGRHRPGSQGSGSGSIPAVPISLPIQSQNNAPSNPLIFDPSNALLQSHHTRQGGISPYANFDLGAGVPQPIGLSSIPQPLSHEKLAAWNAPMFNNLAQNQWGVQSQQQHPSFQAINAQTMFTPPVSANGMSGFLGFEESTPSAAARNRSTSLQVGIHHGTVTPPASGPPSATSYTDTADAFAAAYGAPFNVGANTWKSAKVEPVMSSVSSGNGGGSVGLHYGAAMGMFM